MEKTQSAKLIFDGNIFKVTQDTAQINGKCYSRDIVHHHGGVGILVIQKNKILLVKQFRYAIQETTFEIPAGKLEKDEDPYTCGLRELEEESGYTSPKLKPLCTMYSTPGFCNEQIHLYWTNQIEKVENPLPMDEDENIEIQWISLENALSMIELGKIKDAKTIIALQYAAWHPTTLLK